jgi:hypothetical protein
MTFNIGSQSGGIINNVGGDQVVNGGQRSGGATPTLSDARAAARELRDLIGREAPPRLAAAVRPDLDATAGELAKPAPDRAAVASRLRRLTEALVAAGAFASAGVALGAPLMTLVGWLGPLGGPIRHLITGR